jgi:hypothetical protein
MPKHKKPLQDVLPQATPVHQQKALPVMAEPQRVAARLRIGESFSAAAEAEMTPAGLLAIGGMVAAILLGSAAIVHVARRRPPSRG